MERTAYAGMLRSLRRGATDAIKDGDYWRFFDLVQNLSSVTEGGEARSDVELDFLRERKAVASASEGILPPSERISWSLASADELIDDVLTALPEFIRLRQFLHQPQGFRA